MRNGLRFALGIAGALMLALVIGVAAYFVVETREKQVVEADHGIIQPAQEGVCKIRATNDNIYHELVHEHGWDGLTNPALEPDATYSR